ncbi:hypothetical protein ACYOEI_38765, partial [Singulisphaera rosea]
QGFHLQRELSRTPLLRRGEPIGSTSTAAGSPQSAPRDLLPPARQDPKAEITGVAQFFVAHVMVVLME